jgi:hypothetical protein
MSKSALTCDIRDVGDITILAGTSSSGKSSIAKELIALEPARQEDDLDLRLSPHIPRADDMQETMIDEVMERRLNAKKLRVYMDQAINFLSRITIPLISGEKLFVHDAMIVYAQKMGNSLPSDEQIKMDKVNSLQEFLAKLGVHDGDVSLVITPKHKNDYTLVVDNSAIDGAEGIAELIHTST